MKAFGPYLNFDGITRDAMTFYQACLGGELTVQTFAEMKAPMPPGSENRVIHARLVTGTATLMASDTMPGMPFTVGNNIHVSVECDSIAEIERVFAAFTDGATITMPMQDQFWGARFGMLVDKFGIHWMFNCVLPKTS